MMDKAMLVEFLELSIIFLQFVPSLFLFLHYDYQNAVSCNSTL